MINIMELAAIRTELASSVKTASQDCDAAVDFSSELERELKGITPLQLEFSEDHCSELSEQEGQEEAPEAKCDTETGQLLPFDLNYSIRPEAVSPVISEQTLEVDNQVEPEHMQNEVSNDIEGSEFATTNRRNSPIKTQLEAVTTEEGYITESNNLKKVVQQNISLTELIAQKIQRRSPQAGDEAVEKISNSGEGTSEPSKSDPKTGRSSLAELEFKASLKGVLKDRGKAKTPADIVAKGAEDINSSDKAAINLAVQKADRAPTPALVTKDDNTELSYQSIKEQSDSIISQMTKSITHGKTEDGQYLKVNLKPEYLGEMSIKIQKDSKGCTVNINVDNESLKSVLTEKADEILAGFSNKLVAIDRVIITTEPERTDNSNAMPQFLEQQDMSGQNSASDYHQQKGNSLGKLGPANQHQPDEARPMYSVGEHKVNIYI